MTKKREKKEQKQIRNIIIKTYATVRFYLHNLHVNSQGNEQQM